MGIVPENEHLPGLEGAGVIRRVGSLVSTFKVGQRVLVYEKGTFANRIQVSPERVHSLPDSMSFEVRSCSIVCCSSLLIQNPGCGYHAKCLSRCNIWSIALGKYSEGPSE